METASIISGKFVEAKVFASELETSAKVQLAMLCDQPFAAPSTIRIMPDAHAGAGCVVGTTMTIHDAIVPNLVGVDIGCGMEVVKLDRFSPDFRKLDTVIRENVPSGFALRDKPHRFASEWDMFELFAYHVLDEGKVKRSIGTLGGGNHFIEVAQDEEGGSTYLIIHSGSRNPGLVIANYYQNAAIESREDESIPKALAPLRGEDFECYLHDMTIMQEYADWNRRAIADSILKGMKWKEADRFSTIHNYVDVGSMILRKGAVSAMDGETLLIPMNMRDGSLLCTGKSNPDWNFSAPHGAGRIMSRGESRKTFTLTQFKTDMDGIWTTCVSAETIDENPRAYKPMQEIINHIGPTVDIEAVLKPIYNYKAGETPRKRRKKNAE